MNSQLYLQISGVLSLGAVIGWHTATYLSAASTMRNSELVILKSYIMLFIVQQVASSYERLNVHQWEANGNFLHIIGNFLPPDYYKYIFGLALLIFVLGKSN